MPPCSFNNINFSHWQHNDEEPDFAIHAAGMGENLLTLEEDLNTLQPSEERL